MPLNKETIPWWYTKILDTDLKESYKSLEDRSLSLGKSVRKFEESFCKLENSKYGIATTSGTAALHLVGMSLEIKNGDEIIVPNRTWIATAHAFRSLGAEIKIASVNEDNMLIDIKSIKSLINANTKAIVAVSLNGRNVISKELLEIVRNNDLWLIEDAAQGIKVPRPYDLINSKISKYCRTYSFSMAKMITTGQGGMILTNCESFANELRNRRTHGIENVQQVQSWDKLGLNYRMSDILASLGLNQIRRIEDKIEKYLDVYDFYINKINSEKIKIIPVRIDDGEIPIYIEALTKNRNSFANKLMINKIETRVFYPDISEAEYLSQYRQPLKRTIFSKNGIYLPSGDGITDEQLEKIYKEISKL